MRSIILATIPCLLFCISISLTSNAQGAPARPVRTALPGGQSHSGGQDSDITALKKQLDIMEETIKNQQEMINFLKDKIEIKKIAEISKPTYREENEIERARLNDIVGQVIDNYLAKRDTREKMVKAGLTPEYFSWKNGLRFKTGDGKFKFKLGGRIMNDWGWFKEDKDVQESIGDQVDGTEFRRARLYISGDIYKNIGFKAQYDFASGGRPDFKDVYMELKKIPVLGNFRVGHFKEPFSLEMQNSSKYMTFMERGLNNVFAPERNTGFMLYNHALNKRMTWAMGVFRNADGFGDSEGNRRTEGGYSFSGRITGLPWYEDEGRKLIHTGLSYSHQNAFATDDPTDPGLDTGFQFASKPEIHLASDFVDTGRFTADFANLINPELAIVYGSFSLQTEYTFADINRKRSTIGSNDFTGFYVYGSYFLTGEYRKFETKNGAFGRVKPNKNYYWGKGMGALELTARYSKLDLSDRDIDGGNLDDITLGVNWYLNPNTRVTLNYVHADTDLSNVGDTKDGNADLVAMRFYIDF